LQILQCFIFCSSYPFRFYNEKTSQSNIRADPEKPEIRITEPNAGENDRRLQEEKPYFIARPNRIRKNCIIFITGT